MQKQNNILWTREALNNFDGYIDWYIQNANISIAKDFIRSIEQSIHLISHNRYIARMVDEIPQIREYVVQDYPFLISYWIKSPTEIIITSFLHQKQYRPL